MTVCAALVSICNAWPHAVRAAAPTVTDSFNGVTYQGYLSSEIETFLNIRFGEDTSGQNRFAPPKAFSYAQNEMVNASTNGAACPQSMQLPGFAGGGNITKMSEDCLTLRVDRVQNTTAEAHLPVMVWMYGGGFASDEIYASSHTPTGLLLTATKNKLPVLYVAIKSDATRPTQLRTDADVTIATE